MQTATSRSSDDGSFDTPTTLCVRRTAGPPNRQLDSRTARFRQGSLEQPGDIPAGDIETGIRCLLLTE